ncbi:hypothetical protein LR48_Vigan10g122600 [Vigna angularis]|uniref:Uncharacterized protein n=1 Tax=Phaseolus angularis TaxID=3914 RepID=A0A0L9VKS4_PHAAN|nr:hypothetical protein LR48_Vigan10g122600 [Vigna angularis]
MLTGELKCGSKKRTRPWSSRGSYNSLEVHGDGWKRGEVTTTRMEKCVHGKLKKKTRLEV